MLDLKSGEGRAATAKLAAQADVLIEAFRPGVAARIGLGAENAKPDAVCLSISGFGQTGPYAERPCTDSVAQAFSGMVALNDGADGVPHRSAPPTSDMATGIYAFSAVQAALSARLQDRLTRAGACIDMSLMAPMLNLPTAPIGMNMPSAQWQARRAAQRAGRRLPMRATAPG